MSEQSVGIVLALISIAQPIVIALMGWLLLTVHKLSIEVGVLVSKVQHLEQRLENTQVKIEKIEKAPQHD